MNMSNFCGSGDITKIYVVEAAQNGLLNSLTATTITVLEDLTVGGDIYNCNDDSTIYFNNISACSGGTINVISNLNPSVDNNVNIGSPVRRYREVNTVSGSTTIWTATNVIYTPTVDLGQDISGNTRTITAENSIIQDDILLGGSY